MNDESYYSLINKILFDKRLEESENKKLKVEIFFLFFSRSQIDDNRMMIIEYIHIYYNIRS